MTVKTFIIIICLAIGLWDLRFKDPRGNVISFHLGNITNVLLIIYFLSEFVQWS